MSAHPSLPSMAEIPAQNKFTGPQPPLPARPGGYPASPPPPAKPPIPTRSAGSTFPSPPPEAIIIRTMKDDVTNIGQSQPQAGSGRQISTPAPAPTAAPASFPLPAKSADGKSVIMPASPAKPRGRNKRIVIGAAVILLSAAAAAAGIWYVVSGRAGSLTPEAVITDPQELLPANAVAITEYAFATAAKRQAITGFWAQQTASQPSLSTLLAGDPRLIINDPDVSGMFYINIPQETRPYLLVKKTAQTASVLGQPQAGVALEKNGWYIAHQVSVDSYVNALQAGTLRGTATIQAFPRDFAVRTFLSGEAATQVAAATTISPLSPGTKGPTTLVADLADPAEIVWEGIDAGPAPSPAAAASTLDASVLYLLPSTIEFLHLGPNFSSEINTLYSAVQTDIDQAIIAEPAVKQLLNQLSGQYVYYQRTATSGGHDLGLIIRLPSELKKSLAAGDKTLERALLALVPLVAGRSSPAALVFNDGLYQDIPLKYVNVGGPDKAIDYAIYGDHLFIATSKEGMFALVDKAKQPSAPNGLPQAAGALITGPNASQNVTAGPFSQASLKYILPGIQTPSLAVIGQKITSQATAINAYLTFATP